MERRARILVLLMVAVVGCARSQGVEQPAKQVTDPSETAVASEPQSSVTLVRAPNGGNQPQAVIDAQGTLHLIYFDGEDTGDLYYVRRESGSESFSAPIKVNSTPGSACAAGTVRGGRIALGKNGRVHVAWNGAGGSNGMEMAYTRLNDAGTAFEPQRNLMQITSGLDGGGTVAADGMGNVFVVWHGVKPPERGEDKRRVWVTCSADDGKSFSEEAPAWMEEIGACACCGTSAFADTKGSLYMLYRSARQEVNRDIYLLYSTDQGRHFDGTLIHRWEVPG